MTPEAQRIAIAEACGWFECGSSSDWYWGHKSLPQDKWDVPTDELPDFTGDLNAMHEALNAFGNMAPLTRHQWWQRYSGQLSVVLGLPFDFMPQFSTDDWIKLHNATAAQRAEAFLRTIGKWTDDATKP